MAIVKKKILIVDDELKLRELLVSYLSKEGYDVHGVADAIDMDKYIKKHEIELIILDLMLPGEDGLSIARRLHHSKNIPIIILSARSDELDRIVGLEIGADDYMAKPFSPRELLARIRSVLRRHHSNQNTDTNDNSPIIRFGPFSLDLNKHELVKENKEVLLTIGEFTLLSVFLEHTNHVLTREKLLEISKGYGEHSPFDRSIDICVGRLRKKIEPDPSTPIYIKTVWGVGYIFSVKD